MTQHITRDALRQWAQFGYRAFGDFDANGEDLGGVNMFYDEMQGKLPAYALNLSYMELQGVTFNISIHAKFPNMVAGINMQWADLTAADVSATWLPYYGMENAFLGLALLGNKQRGTAAEYKRAILAAHVSACPAPVYPLARAMVLRQPFKRVALRRGLIYVAPDGTLFHKLNDLSLEDAHYRPFELPSGAVCRLAHMRDFTVPDVMQAWCDVLTEREILQPFKQLETAVAWHAWQAQRRAANVSTPV